MPEFSILTETPRPKRASVILWPILPIGSSALGGLIGYDFARGGDWSTAIIALFFLFIVGLTTIVAGVASFFTVEARKVALVSFLCALLFCITFGVVNSVSTHVRDHDPVSSLIVSALVACATLWAAFRMVRRIHHGTWR